MHADAVCWLVQHGADIKKVKADGWNDTALHFAAASGRLPAVQALLAAGCDAGARNFAGHTPADVAARKGRNAVAVYLTNVQSGNQPVPSRSELIDNRKFEWSYKNLHSDPVSVDLTATSKAAVAADAASKAQVEQPQNKVNITANAGSNEQSPATGPEPHAAAQGNAGVSANTAGNTQQIQPRGQDSYDQLPQEYKQAIETLTAREFYGMGTTGTEPKFTVPIFRWLAALQVGTAIARAVLMHQSCSQCCALLLSMHEAFILHACSALCLQLQRCSNLMYGQHNVQACDSKYAARYRFSCRVHADLLHLNTANRSLPVPDVARAALAHPWHRLHLLHDHLGVRVCGHQLHNHVPGRAMVADRASHQVLQHCTAAEAAVLHIGQQHI